MKALPILLLFSSSLNAQQYLPFGPDAPKRFYESANPANDDHYFYSIADTVSNDTLYMDHYLKENRVDQVDVSNTYCSGWGGGMANLVDSTWLGRNFEFDLSNRILGLRNRQGESLFFDFGLALGDSALIYQNANTSYYLIHDSDDEQVIHAYTDSVKNFRIVHYDGMGAPVLSPLHNYTIRLGKDIGLISFMNCYMFPMEETAMELMGQIEPRIGTYRMTYDQAFPWEVGDVLHYRGYTPAIIPMNYISYLEYTVINKVITADSVYIYLDSTEQIVYPFDTATSSIPLPNYYYNIRYNSPIKFKKNSCIFKEPEFLVRRQYYDRYYEDSANFCGMADQEILTGAYTLFCDSCSCLPPADGFMQSFHRITYTAGLGITNRSESYYGPPQGFPSADLIYNNLDVNGNVPCGAAITFGVDELEQSTYISPNPSEGMISIRTEGTPKGIALYSMSGQKLAQWSAQPMENIIDLRAFSPGIYLVQVEFEQGTISRKIVLQ